MPICENCGKQFPHRIKVEGRTWSLTSRRFCPGCSELGGNNRRRYVVEGKDGMAFCTRCQEHKPEDDFHRRANGAPLSYCKSCSERAKSLKFEEKMEELIVMRGGACADCQGTFPMPVFRFWKDGKAFVTSRAKSMSLKRLMDILAGHEMLCLNCAAIRKWEKG